MPQWISRSSFLINAPLENLWLGTSIENQQSANERCPFLTQLTEIGYTTFLSMEPLLESIDLAAAGAIEQFSGDTNKFAPNDYEPLVSWVIVGGESGHNARYCSPLWIRSIVNQCKATGIPVYVKQLGTDWAKQSGTHRSDPKGANPQFWAEDLLFREFPSVRSRF